MKKELKRWKVSDLLARYPEIDFPEYQREPTVWGRDAKQRLLDSMLRRFDMASIYLYKHDEGEYDCIDGRQRLNAIMSFVGRNEEGEDNKFEFQIKNEIEVDTNHPFQTLDGLTFEKINERAKKGEEDAKRFLKDFHDYEINVVLLSDSEKPSEFNLQFARLNLGTIINSGEKLNAMVGDLRNECFDEGGIGKHKFLDVVKIPTKRYSQEQVAAQILAQAFSLESKEGYARTRHFDLQRLFKEHYKLKENEKKVIKEIHKTMDRLAGVVKPGLLKNRAMTVSVVILAWEKNLDGKDLKTFTEYLEQCLGRLKQQLAKGLEVKRAYYPLIDFQKQITQASVEKPAIKARNEFLANGLSYWEKHRKLEVDVAYEKETGNKPEPLNAN